VEGLEKSNSPLIRAAWFTLIFSVLTIVVTEWEQWRERVIVKLMDEERDAYLQRRRHGLKGYEYRPQPSVPKRLQMRGGAIPRRGDLGPRRTGEVPAEIEYSSRPIDGAGEEKSVILEKTEEGGIEGQNLMRG
jgi:hypothetical protein